MKSKTLLLLLAFALLAWAGSSDAAEEEIYFCSSIKVSDSTTVARLIPSIAVDTSGNINIVWMDCRDGFDTEDIYFSRSTDEGLTWSPSVKVNDELPGNCINPSLDVDASGNLYVAWEQEWDENVYFSMSVDSGETWTEDVRVNEDTPEHHGNPSLAADTDGNIYVTWTDARNDLADIYFAMSTDAGSTWTTPNVKVNSPSSGLQLKSHVTIGDSGWVYAVWDDDRSGDDDVFFSMSKDSGRTWSPDVRVNDDEQGHINDPCVALGKDGAIYVVWEVGGIYFARSTDDGQTWTSPNIKVNSDSLDMITYYCPCVSAGDGERVYVVWRARNGQDYQTHIYCATSRDSGNTWTDPEIRVDDSLCFRGEYPSLDVHPSGKVYVAWDGSRITMQPVEIFFALGKPATIFVTEPLQHGIPKTFKLFQNYPNPFNPTTQIKYDLPVDCRVRLDVYNVVGQQVATLDDSHQKAGYKTARWDASSFSSGIYFYRLQAGDFVQTKKMVVLK